MIGCKKDWPVKLKADERDMLITLLLAHKPNDEVQKEIRISVLDKLDNAEPIEKS